ncbi:MAG: peptide chain release factor N(5)-glutamine methyltransferase [Candidatus Omnitrophica bacterium]|nr:peptide chain release factor N(5)-glutamine methyltransferase [Candidatus Omnitrophota bacterium]
MNEAELLFTHLLSCNRTQLYIDREKSLDKERSIFVSNILKRRIKGEPLQYILGRADFMGLDFYVDPNVFIPRPETELLVETAIRKLQTVSNNSGPINILDIGTGSGCIAISLAKFMPRAQIIATDISSFALAVARKNAEIHRVEGRIKFINSDLFQNEELWAINYELIISNPPYIPSAQIERLPREVKCEPRLALDGGENGLDYVEPIIKTSQQLLKPQGFLIIEIGWGQSGAVKNLFGKNRAFNIIEVVKDYNQIDRVMVAKKR